MGGSKDRDKTDVFEHPGGGGRADWLIADGEVPVAEKAKASWHKIKNLSVRDLYFVIGFNDDSGGGGMGDIPAHIKQLSLDDIHALGRCFANHLGMGYPDKVFSCCCCG